MTTNLQDLSNTSDSNLQGVLSALEAEQARRRTEDKLRFYKPYVVQKRFHDAGAVHRERLFCAANRIGKSTCGSAETAYHLTGLYPDDWWQGKRFDKPVRAWAAGVTNESVRDVLQDKLVGPPFRRAEWGHGLIPKHCIGEVSMACGIADLIDTISVLHVSGGYSSLQFKSYSEGRSKWQGVGLEVVYMDEEPPEDLYFEALTRTNETGGTVYTCFTPLLGMSTVVRMFLQDGIKL
jgi:phage terminase large subunit-like protein